MKNIINNKTLFYSLILIFIVIILIILIIVGNSGAFTNLNKYKNNVLSITDDYLNAKITKDEAIDKLDIIEKQVVNDYKNNNDFDYHYLSSNIESLKLSIRYDNLQQTKELYNSIKKNT